MNTINIKNIVLQFDSHADSDDISDHWVLLDKINELLQTLPEQPQLFIEHLDKSDVSVVSDVD